MTTITDQFQTVNELHKIRNKYIEEQKIIKQSKYMAENQDINIEKAKRQLSVFTDYSVEAFESKVKMDAYIYADILSLFEDSERVLVGAELDKLYEITNSIYEHLNISPQYNVYFRKLTLESSEEELAIKGKSIVDTYISENFHKLSTDQKSKRYAGPVVDKCITMLQESNRNAGKKESEIADYLKFCYKSQIFEGLVNNIALPYLVQCNIDSCLNNDIYDEIFEKDELRDTVDRYDTQLTLVSNLFATVI